MYYPQKVLFLYLFVQNSDFSNPKNKNKRLGKCDISSITTKITT